jgi:hypothetical protein
MPHGRRQRPNAARLLVLSLWAALTSAAGPAAAARSHDSGMGPIAQKAIRITLSVRETVSIRSALVRPGDGPQQHGRSFCVSSNSPMSRYNVTAEIRRDLETSKPHVVVQSGILGCLTQGSVITLLDKLETPLANAHSPNVVTLVISPD